MVFSSLIFLCIFLPVVLALYHLCKNIHLKNAILLIASLVFYAWGEPKWIVVMIATTVIDYIAGLLISRCKEKSVTSKILLAISVIITLGFLIVFKYLNFFTLNLSKILPFDFKATNLTLPIGISFYTFQALSYVVDVYRGDVKVQKNYFKLLLYVCMFPQLIAGPIVRYVDISNEISNRHVTVHDFSDGVTRFSVGLAKKAVLANLTGALATEFLSSSALPNITVLGSWIGIIAYTFQIYFDFSGYSDMAIGMGKMLGFNFNENFNYPYTAVSVTDFWRRWHISLSSFFRDYVYIPLGGNRKYHLRNMFIVWVLTGFWHGASWNFVLWGFYYFLVLAFEKFVIGKFLQKLPKFIGRIYSLFFVIIGWVFFYFEDMKSIGIMLKSMFGFAPSASSGTDVTLLTNNMFLLIISFVAVIPVAKLAKSARTKLVKSANGIIFNGVITFLFQAFLIITSIACLVGSTYNPFLYFRF